MSLLVHVLAATLLVLGPVSPPPGVWPLQPDHRVVHGFDPPAQAWGSGHRGVDLLGSPGEVVHATAAGTVSFAATLAGRGVVVVDHGSVRTTYEPVAATISVGDPVSAGDPIGTLQTGRSHCFPRSCLHWGLRRGEEYLDPLLLVGQGPIRLLPMDRVPTRALAAPATSAILPVPPLLGLLRPW